MGWFASHGLGRYFAAVYLGYYHFGQLLFYQFLHVEPYSSIPSAGLYAEKCKDHAANLCEMIYRAFETPNSDVLYTMVAHVLVIASTVQIHTLLFSSDENRIGISRARLERNFGILLHLKPQHPAIKYETRVHRLPACIVKSPQSIHSSAKRRPVLFQVKKNAEISF